MNVTRFTADRAFASVGCTRTSLGSSNVYSAQTVNCVINGEESIFTSSTSGCESEVSLSGGTNYYFTTYNNVDYFVWYDGNVASQPTTDQQTLIDAILSSCGLSTGGASNAGWHAGTYTFTVEDYFTNSY